VDSDVLYSAFFVLPSGKVLNVSSEFAQLSQLRHEPDNRRKSHINLTIEHAEAERDGGDYRCTIKDQHENTNSEDVIVTFVDHPIMEFRVTNQNITVTKAAKKRVQFLVGYTAFPSATFEMYNNHNELIARGTDVFNRTKYDVIISKYEVKFQVKSPDIEDYGEFTLLSTTGGQNYTQKLNLVVSGEPSRFIAFQSTQNNSPSCYHHRSQSDQSARWRASTSRQVRS
jgi:hypothetical protein